MGSTPQAPTPPDPVATANAQGTMNKETAVANANLNRINQYTPQGSLTYQQVGTNADGTPQYQSTQSYSPGQQAIYDAQTATSVGLNQLAQNNVGAVAAAQATPFNYNNMTPLQTSVATGPMANSYGTGGNIATGYNAGGSINNSYDAGGNIQTGYNTGGNIQTGLNFSNASALPGINDFGAQNQATQNAAYQQATSRLDPQWQLQQQQLASSLAAKGVTENSAAYRSAMDQFQNQKTDAYNQATYSSIGAGNQEQAQLFGLALQGRQQGVAEDTAQGQFANAAQQQQYAQNQQLAAFGNTAQAQQNAQNAAAAQYSNTAQAQANQQNALAAAFQNSGQQQANQQNMQQAAFQNTAQQQTYNQAAANAALNNQGRQQQISEATYLRNLPLQDISTLMGTGGGVSNPNFAGYAQANVANTDYSGLVENQYNQQNQQYMQKVQQQGSALGGIFGTLGSLGSTAGSIWSDRRLKANIKAIGELASGIKTYVFNYIWDSTVRFGVMADEVINVKPEAVDITNGYMTVDYGRIW